MRFNGERVVIGDMKSCITTLQEHIARYNFALLPALNKKVLDASCGTGYGTKLLAEAANNVVGVDIDMQTVKYAKAKYKDIIFRRCNLDKKFPKGLFDLCVSFETIEHLENPKFFLKNVAKNCKEFLFSIPVNNQSEYHKHVWSKEKIVKMINKYWHKVEWYHQNGLFIHGGLENATFIIGYAMK